MIQSGVTGVQFIAMNTDQQSLAQSKAHVKIPLGPISMRGLGAGGNAERGAVAAEESRDEILAQLQGADMVFITGGMGGGTGTGAAPVVASCAREFGALTVAVVLTPFHWEGVNKSDKAALGLENLRNTADTVIVVSNQKLLSLCDKGVKVKEAYRIADGVLIQGVRGITARPSSAPAPAVAKRPCWTPCSGPWIAPCWSATTWAPPPRSSSPSWPTGTAWNCPRWRPPWAT
jgi:cell division protein FtsZ